MDSTDGKRFSSFFVEASHAFSRYLKELLTAETWLEPFLGDRKTPYSEIARRRVEEWTCSKPQRSPFDHRLAEFQWDTKW
jgi:hypothetical protein